MITQAYNNSQAENGMYQTWDIAADIGTTEYFNRYWKPYLKVAKICSTSSDCGYKADQPWKFPNGDPNTTRVVFPNQRTAFLTPDGTVFVIFSISGGVPDNRIYIDLNGSKEPNITGKDFFYFLRTDKGILPNCHSGTIASVNSNCSKTGTGTCCAAKLARDGWEIKDNYPW